MPDFYVEGCTAEGVPYGPVHVMSTPIQDGVCERCLGEEVIWGGCFGNGDSNYFDPCPDCQGYDPDEEEAEQAREDAWRGAVMLGSSPK